MKFVIVPGGGTGGYGRKNFISLRTVQFDLYTCKGIAHEMAHFWWHNAEANTWEDWLNEAFAEYSMLMYLREKIDINIFNRYISEYKKKVEKSPPIWGIDRAKPEAYSALYEKGSLILMEFEEKLGQEQFLDFLRLILKEKVANTNEFLDLIEKVLPKDIRLWFENKLKTY